MASPDPVAVAKAVLSADGEAFATLSLAPGLSAVTAATPVPEARRNYMRLAGMIHPDKIKHSFDKATEAFQCLVRAFECFADPKARKTAAAAAARAQQATAGTAKAATKRKKNAAARPPSSQGSTGRKTPATSQEKGRQGQPSTPAQKPRRKTKKAPDSDEDDESEEEDETEEDSDVDSGSEAASGSDEDDEGFGSKDVEPTVSTSRTPIGQPRTGGVYVETSIHCPHCRTRWMPDTKPQYSLFMGPWGKQVHCQCCLFVFGSATALHKCPHCAMGFDYDASQYEETIECPRKSCRKTIGFPYYPVNQYLIDTVRLEDWREKRERERTKERETRLRAREHGKTKVDEAAEKQAVLVGTCIIDDRCPLCHKRVDRRHRAHVEACLRTRAEDDRAEGPTGAAAAPKPPVKKRSKAAVSPPAAVTSAKKAKAPAARGRKAPAPRAKTTKKAAASSPAGRKRRRRGSSSDEDDEDEVSVSDSEADDESSFSEESADESDSDDE